MSKDHFKPTDYFDPEQWSTVYDTNKRNGSTFVFRHGVDLVLDISLSIGTQGGLWVDAGCGTGDLAAKLSKTGRSVIGIDHDSGMIDYAKERFLNEHSTDKLKFILASAYDLPFGNETIDGIVATSLTGCLSSPEKFFQETCRVLRRGGFAIMTFTNRASLLLKINRHIRSITSVICKLTDDNFLFRLYHSDNIAGDLERIGLRVVDIRYYNFFLNAGNWLIPAKPFALYLEGLNKYKIGHRLGRNFIIVAQKT